MPRIALTDATIRALKSTGRQESYWCNLTPNFGVRVSQHGGKSFFVMVGRKRKRIHLGKYPFTSLKDARVRARSLLLSSSYASEKTFSVAFETFFETIVRPNNKPKTAREILRLFSRHAAPLSGRPIASITTADLSTLFPPLAHVPSQANHFHKILGMFFRYAVQHAVISTNPLTFPKPYKQGTRERVLTDSELVALYRAAAQMGYPFGLIVLICIHCAYRIGEVAAMKWSYISDDYITLPPQATKSGREHVMPNVIHEHLALIPRRSEYLFPSTKGTRFVALSFNKDRLDVASGVTNWTLHDLRRTFSSKCAEWQVASPDIIERLLGHSTALSPIAQVYNRWHYLPEMRAALLLYQKKLLELIKNIN